MRISHSGLNALWPWIILFMSLIAGLTVFTDAVPTLRPWLVFSFLILCPGMAFIRLLRTGDWIIKATLAVALSLALNTVVALLLLYFRVWSPINGVMMVIGISLLGTMVKFREDH